MASVVYRLAQMLVKLNQGEKLNLLALADEFGVNLHTLQRVLALIKYSHNASEKKPSRQRTYSI